MKKLIDQRIVQEIIHCACEMNRLGINVNKSGNVSHRFVQNGVEGFLITPTGIPYECLQGNDIVFVPLTAHSLRDFSCKRIPSSEWQMHAEIYRNKADVTAVVHTHSVNATALACQEMAIPAFHYMVAVAGGEDIPCAPYALFGTQELANQCIKYLSDRKACLLAHHGVIATGSNLPEALRLAHEVENLAKSYILVRQLGEPKLLSKDQMQLVIERFRTYGTVSYTHLTLPTTSRV